jgi:hypothetical protein
VEARLAAGTYGASVLSGRPIPDERLEAFPLAELTVDEAAERDRNLGGKRKPESRIGPSRDPFRVFEDPAAQDDGLVEDEGGDDEPAQRPTSASERPRGLTLPKVGPAVVQRWRGWSCRRRQGSGL